MAFAGLAWVIELIVKYQQCAKQITWGSMVFLSLCNLIDNIGYNILNDTLILCLVTS